MKKNISWMYLYILTLMSIGGLLASCTDNSDNTPTPPAEGYTIEVGESMTMPENEFVTKIPATNDYDPEVVKALEATENITDVKPFKLVHAFDFIQQKFITKTAYYFNYKQYIDHENPSKGWFKQQCVLSVAGKDRPTVLHTEGYDLGHTNTNRLDSIFEPTLVSVLEANCLQVEYRYHGWSLPEGYTNKFNYLNCKQQSDDLHAIVTTIKNSGIISKSSKWVATGVSKSGMTTAHYAYHHPNDMDVYVPFCAPFLTSLSDQGPSSYILTPEALGGRQQVWQSLKDAFRTYVSDKSLQAECLKLAKKDYPQQFGSGDDEKLRIELLKMLFENYYRKMSYVKLQLWQSLIPKAGDGAERYIKFIMSDQNTRYTDESGDEYERRQDFNDAMDDLKSGSTPLFLTRSGEPVKRHDPYSVQTCIDLGNFAISLEWIKDLLTDAEKNSLIEIGDPAYYGVKYDDGKFIREFLDGMKQSDCNMCFVYGMQDPWTGGRIPDDKLGKNSQILYIENGTHNDAIETYNSSERNQLFQWLHGLGFDL